VKIKYRPTEEDEEAHAMLKLVTTQPPFANKLTADPNLNHTQLALVALFSQLSAAVVQTTV